MFLEVGQQVPVNALLYGLMVSSGNDAAMALAEYLGGSEEGFVVMMNDYCHRLGLNETHFDSPDGLPEPDQYTTASDMVKLGGRVMKDFPDALELHLGRRNLPSIRSLNATGIRCCFTMRGSTE